MSTGRRVDNCDQHQSAHQANCSWARGWWFSPFVLETLWASRGIGTSARRPWAIAFLLVLLLLFLALSTLVIFGRWSCRLWRVLESTVIAPLAFSCLPKLADLVPRSRRQKTTSASWLGPRLTFLTSAFSFVRFLMFITAILSSGTLASLKVVANALRFASRRWSVGCWGGVSLTWNWLLCGLSHLFKTLPLEVLPCSFHEKIIRAVGFPLRCAIVHSQIMRERLEVLDGVVKVSLLPHHVRLGSHSSDHRVPSGDETP